MMRQFNMFTEMSPFNSYCVLRGQVNNRGFILVWKLLLRTQWHEQTPVAWTHPGPGLQQCHADKGVCLCDGLFYQMPNYQPQHGLIHMDLRKMKHSMWARLVLNSCQLSISHEAKRRLIEIMAVLFHEFNFQSWEILLEIFHFVDHWYVFYP